jgi:hypothetical protein
MPDALWERQNLLVPQSLDWIHPRHAAGWEVAEQQSENQNLFNLLDIINHLE